MGCQEGRGWTDGWINEWKERSVGRWKEGKLDGQTYKRLLKIEQSES